jgi:glycosyltransferase involved in cell wall biosynthesis
LRVGVDARILSRPLTGIGRYTLEMCRALSNKKGISLYLYSPAPIRPEVLRGLGSANIRTKNWNNGLLRQFWGETYLPLWVNRDQLDVLWGPAHRLPRCLPRSTARVVTIHDLVWKYAGDTMRPVSRLLERYQMPVAVRSADAVVADSKATANAVKEEFLVDLERLFVVPLGASLTETAEPFDSLQKYNINHSYFLFVGTLEPRKNLHRLLKAYSQLSDPLKSQASLVIAGGKGWGGVDINNVVIDLGLEKHVCILGYVDDSTLATLYANALFLAMPSLYEGFGLPLVEAMVRGTPVLTSNNSSMPEVAGNAGLLIDPLDILSIKNGLEELIVNDNLRITLTDNALKHIVRFNWDTAAKQLVSVLEIAISDRESYQQ